MLTNRYYRPEWTCGRFNPKAQVAIYYNLIEGMSYYFESYSAIVIGEILSVKRNDSFDLQMLSNNTGIGEASLTPFMETLCEMGLLCSQSISNKEIAEYRKQTLLRKSVREDNKVSIQKDDDYPIELNDAELAYTEKSGGVTSVMIELTYNCSEKCIHCYNIGATRNSTEQSHRNDLQVLSLEDYRRIIDELYEEGVIKVCLSGGDPFSSPYVWQIIEYLYNKGIAFDIYTNGFNLKGKEEVLASFYPRLVGLSVYSGDSEVHDSITRTQGSWTRTMAVMETLHCLAVPQVIKCAIFKNNVKSYRRVSAIGERLHIPVQFELNIIDSIEGDKCVSKYLRLPYNILEIVFCDPNTVSYVGADVKDFGKYYIDVEKNACKAGYNSFCITPDGNFIPCCSFHLVFGNLRNQHLNDILRDNPILHQWQRLIVKNYYECGTHEYCSYCNVCAGQNYAEHGTPLRAAENSCHLAKVRFNLAKRMKEENYDPLNGLTIDERLNKLPDFNIGDIKREF